MSNLRHLLLHGDYLYASINSKGYVQRIPLRRIYDAISDLQPDKKTTVLDGWESCKVPAGARTIVISPDGRFVFAACNFSSKIAVVDTRTMKLVGTLDADSYPVGLDISQDGRYLFSTSQARDAGGNAVDIFRIDYK
jgi:DNA-binding beta-propeller fold protein YncE